MQADNICFRLQWFPVSTASTQFISFISARLVFIVRQYPHFHSLQFFSKLATRMPKSYDANRFPFQLKAAIFFPCPDILPHFPVAAQEVIGQVPATFRALVPLRHFGCLQDCSPPPPLFPLHNPDLLFPSRNPSARQIEVLWQCQETGDLPRILLLIIKPVISRDQTDGFLRRNIRQVVANITQSR